MGELPLLSYRERSPLDCGFCGHPTGHKANCPRLLAKEGRLKVPVTIKGRSSGHDVEFHPGSGPGDEAAATRVIKVLERDSRNQKLIRLKTELIAELEKQAGQLDDAATDLGPGHRDLREVYRGRAGRNRARATDLRKQIENG
jgi:hypothetical protein